MPSEAQPAADHESGAVQNHLAYWGGVTILGLVYLAVAVLSLQLAFLQEHASPVWPPSGLAVGALIVFGRRYAPGVFLGAFLASIYPTYRSVGADPSFFAGAAASLVIGAGNMLEACLAAWLMEKYAGGRHCLERVGGVLRFILLGAHVPPLVSAGLGVVSLAVAGFIATDGFLVVLLTWYTGNAVGILTVAPLVLCIFRRPVERERKRRIEAAAQLGLLFVVCQAIWGSTLPDVLRGLPNPYMAIPFVLWAALRLGQPVTVVSILVLSATSIAGTLRGHAVFPGPSPTHSLIYLQTYIGVITVMGLAISALVKEIRETNEGLEHAVEERTVRLERLLREKDEILSVAVHELQSPLAGLRNLFQLLRRNPEALSDAEGGGRLMGEMEATADAMLHQVTQLLETQRLGDQFDSRTPSETNLGRLLEECVRMQRPTAVAKDIAINVETPDRPVHAFTNRGSVEHILGNLLSNAIKFTPSGRAVRVRLVRAGAEARFEVEDQGPGIPRGQLERLFGKFERGGSEPTGNEASTGLGLYIAGRLVDRLGGQIRCRSVDGEGSCFIVSLPFRPPRETPTGSHLGNLPR